MAFSDQTTRKLRAKLNGAHVRTRQWQGKTLSYIEGWHAVSEANRIFGYDGWSRETVDLRCLHETKTQQGTNHGPAQDTDCAYLAKVRISVRAGEDTIVREGTGAGYTKAASLAEAHALAAKEAETDATKRALSTFGNPFGLALYDRDRKGVRNPKPAKPKQVLLAIHDKDGGGQCTLYRPSRLRASLARTDRCRAHTERASQPVAGQQNTGRRSRKANASN